MPAGRAPSVAAVERSGRSGGESCFQVAAGELSGETMCSVWGGPHRPRVGDDRYRPGCGARGRRRRIRAADRRHREGRWGGREMSYARTPMPCS
jgi:hypothetical protein